MAYPWSNFPPDKFDGGGDLTPAALAERKLSVDVYHLNVGLGDCAIYFLVEHPDGKHQDWKLPYIHRAVLIDGGFQPPKDEIHPAEGFMKENVQDKYQFLPVGDDKPWPAFDSMVITHWDSDHYEGVLYLLVKDLYLHDPTNTKNWTSFLESYKNPLLKYNKDGDHAKRAKSFLYVPYWSKRGVGKFPAKGSANKDRVFYKDGADIYFSANKDSWTTTVEKSKRYWTKGMCRLQYDVEGVLAANLFTNAVPTIKDYPSPRDLAVIHTEHQDLAKANPCLVVVSVNGVCTGSSTVDENQWPARFDQIYNSKWFKNQNQDPEIWNEDHLNSPNTYPFPEDLTPASQFNGLVQDVGGLNLQQNRDGWAINVIDDPLPQTSEAKVTNALSIITMVIWGDGHISHYSGGDANWENELKGTLKEDGYSEVRPLTSIGPVVWWVWSSNNPYKTVRAIKLSHHGSADSTPIELIRGFRPRSIIVSAFDEYGHPRWEVLLWLYFWRAATNDVRKGWATAKRSYGFLYPTCYPYYLAYEVLPNKEPREAWLGSHISVKALTTSEKSKQNQKYVDSLRGLIEKVRGGDDIIGEFQILESTPLRRDKNDHKIHLYKETRNAFHAMSDLGDAATPRATSIVDDQLLNMTDEKQVQWVLVRCRPWDFRRRVGVRGELDGETEFSTFKLSAEQARKRKESNEEKAKRIARSKGEIELEDIVRRFELVTQAARNSFYRGKMPRDAPLETYRKQRAKYNKEYVAKSKNTSSLLKKEVAMGDELDDLDLTDFVCKRLEISLKDFHLVARDTPEAYLTTFVQKCVDLNKRKMEERNEKEEQRKKEKEKRDGRYNSMSFESDTDRHSIAVNDALTSTSDKDIMSFLSSLGISQVKAVTLLSTLEDGSQAVSVVYDGGASATASSARILASTLFDNFLASMRFSQIRFSKLAPKVSEDDEMFTFFQTALQASEVNLDLDIATADAKSATFKGLRVKITNPVEIEYSSQNLLSASTRNFKMADHPTYQMSGPAYFFADDSILLGLTSDSGKSLWTLKEVLVALDLLSEDAANLLQVLRESMDAKGGQFTLAAGALWFTPGKIFVLRNRLEWHLSGADVVSVQNFVHRYFPKLTLAECRIVGRREIRKFDSRENIDYVTSHEFSLVLRAKYNDKLSFGAIIDIKYGGDDGSITLTISPPAITIKEIIVWAIGLFDPQSSNVSEKDTSSILDFVNAIPIIDAVTLRRLEISISDAKMNRLTLLFEINPGWKDKQDKEIPFLVTYTYTPSFLQPHRMTAQPWLAATEQLTSKTPRPFLYDYDDFRSMKPSVSVSDYLYLSSIMPGDWINSLPKGLDLAIVDARIVLNGKKVSLFGRLISHIKDENERQEKTKSLGLSLNEVKLAASFEYGGAGNDDKKPNPNSYSVELGVSLDLTPFYGEDIEVEPVRLRGTIQYQSVNNEKYLSLETSIENLTFMSILNFFPIDDAAVIVDTLGDFSIKCLDIKYKFDSGGNGSDFSITAIILLGPVELDLVFHRDQLTWNFNAQLGLDSSSDITLEELLETLLGDADIVQAIPEFIKKTPLGGSDDAPDDKFKLSISLSLESKDVPVNPEDKSPQAVKNSFFVMSLSLAVPIGHGMGIEFSYLQVSNKSGQKDAKKTDTSSFTKRVIRATIGNLPWGSIPKVPMVSRVEPPFDELDFLWVGSDLTRSDISVIGETGGLRYKDIVPTQKTTDVLLQAGWHFILTPKSVGAVAILDYTFNKKSKTKSLPAPDKPSGSSTPGPAPTPGPTDGVAGSGGTEMAPFEKTVGPLKISNIGVRFEKGEIILYLDAMIKLGPVGFLLKGFGMGISTKGPFADIITTPPSLHIQGIGVEFDCPPITLAGMFLNLSTGDDVIYMGGLTLGIQPYSLMAVGSYAQMAAKDGKPAYKSVFVYARLDGPLVELGWMTVSGVMIGIGYNSSVRQPSVSEITEFPFLSRPTAVKESPLAAMARFSDPDPKKAWIKPQDGSFWVAAGAKIKAFQMLEAEAVLMVQLGTSVSVGIAAIGCAQMPPKVKRELTFLYIELGITASFDPQVGALRVEGQLTPNSFVLHPSCHLTGGFALCSWFDNSPYSGDFVFSIGGYHPAYKPPSHYPVPQRLGISWDVGGGLMITGNAYFAITPKCCMGGAMLKAVLSLGHLYAYFTLYADFLINFAPFYFQGQLGVSVGVRYIQDLWFVSITISVDIDAELRLCGPPFGGTAHVNFWIFGFDVEFGDRSNPVAALSFKKFRALILNCEENKIIDYKLDDQSRPPIDDAHTLTIAVGRRVLPNADAATEKAGDMWHVNLGGFRFQVESKIPVQTVNNQKFGPTQAFFAKPMQRREQLGSTLTVKVEAIERGLDNAVHKVEKPMYPGPITKRMPTSLWGEYDPNSDPSQTSDTSKLDGLLSPAPGTDTLDCLIGGTFSNPPAETPTEAIQPFDPRVCMKQSIFTADDHIVPIVPAKTVLQHPGWLAAEPRQVPADDPAMLWKVLRESWKKPKLSTILMPPSVPIEPLPDVQPATVTVTSGTVDVTANGTQQAPPKPVTMTGGTSLDQKPVEAAEEQERKAQEHLTESIVDAWSEAFSWDTSTDMPGGDLGLKLKRERPTLLWERFEQLYMSAPMVAQDVFG